LAEVRRLERKKDPKTLAYDRKYKREWYRRKHWNGARNRVEKKYGKKLPIGPLSKFLEEHPNIFQLSRRIGINDSRLYHLRDRVHYKNGRKYEVKQVTVTTVIRIAEAAGAFPWEIYPELDHDD
jgi:hypothetical protein